MRLLKTIIVAIQTVLLLAACDADSYEYENKYQCYFNFDCSIHQGTVLQSCVNPVSPGLFCMVSQQTNGGIRYIRLQLYNHHDEEVAITSALELRHACILGAENGLIIGCSTLNNGQLYAFDRLCPNCIKSGITRDLQWNNNGLWVSCPNCMRVYDLNNNGFIVEGEKGDKLLKYRASYNGAALMVSN